MELKDYQKIVLNDLDAYIEVLLKRNGNMPESFKHYWQERGVLNQSYKNNVVGVPHVCIKVPTAGGKTFIAVNALNNIFNAFEQYNPKRPKLVVWLVPWTTILDQTVKNLSDNDHPYRQRLNELFNGRVQVHVKDDVLLGAGFNADNVREQLTVVVMAYNSLKRTNKDGLRAYRDNGYLASFLHDTANDDALLPEYDKSALINVIRTLKPVVIVDESHNTDNALSVEMLQNLNPRFILDLTATPRNNSNIISYVDAMQLKKQNMVKLPVIVANQRSQEDVIMAALKMRKQLEEYAKQEEAQGGMYIRPIVLFQAEPRNNDDTTTFEKVKQTLLELNIPENQIKIKTATINELKNIGLMSRDCPVRYIITINALKEGWDCPFAYVLATLANKSSVVDVTQILGRILRLPHVSKHQIDYLNLSYVFTASGSFQATLNQVVIGLNKAGFSNRDYREFDFSEDIDIGTQPTQQNLPLAPPISPEAGEVDDNGVTGELNNNWENDALNELQETTPLVSTSISANNNLSNLNAIKAQALAANQAYESQAQNTSHNDCPPELEADMNVQKMIPEFAKTATSIELPQFFQKVQTGGFFDEGDEWQKLSRNNLLTGFKLANLDSQISFDDVDSEVYQVDLRVISKDDSSVEFSSFNKSQKLQLNAIIRNQSDESKTKSVVERLFYLLGKNAFYPIEDKDVRDYLAQIIKPMSSEQLHDCLDKDYLYIKKIKEKITYLADNYASIEFDKWLRTGKLKLIPEFKFPGTITPSENAPAFTKSLYVREAGVNGFERDVINAITQYENILWWHRNLERGKGFVINGFINHYPDFVVLTKNNNLILVETKGGDRDNSDSAAKIVLGKAWENAANSLSHSTGLRYHYMMIFQDNAIENSFVLSKALDLIKHL